MKYEKASWLSPPADQDTQGEEGQGKEGGPSLHCHEETGGLKSGESFVWENV